MNRRKAILIISTLDFWSMGEGKGGPALWQTLRGYAKRGWKVYFITSNHGQDTTQYLHNNIHVFRFDALLLKKLMRIKKFGFFAKLVWYLWSQIIFFVKSVYLHRQYKFVLVYGYEISVIPVAKILSKLWQVPMVSRFQGTILVEAMKLTFWKVRMWEHYLGFRVPSNLLIMTNDGTQGDKVLRKLGVDMNRVKFWMNGIDWKPFETLLTKQDARESLNIDTKNVLLTVSRLVSWKRVDRSIQNLPGVVKDFSSTLLVIVGDGPERKHLEQLSRKLLVNEYVRFEGAVRHAEIPKYMAAADIFLSFYDWSNVGNPLLEAMMAGKCIITLNNGDTKRFIQNGKNGILIKYDDLPILSGIIKELLVNEEQCKRLGAKARKFAEKHFWSWDERLNAEIQAVGNLLK